MTVEINHGKREKVSQHIHKEDAVPAPKGRETIASSSWTHFGKTIVVQDPKAQSYIVSCSAKDVQREKNIRLNRGKHLVTSSDATV